MFFSPFLESKTFTRSRYAWALTVNTNKQNCEVVMKFQGYYSAASLRCELRTLWDCALTKMHTLQCFRNTIGISEFSTFHLENRTILTWDKIGRKRTGRTSEAIGVSSPIVISYVTIFSLVSPGHCHNNFNHGPGSIFTELARNTLATGPVHYFRIYGWS